MPARRTILPELVALLSLGHQLENSRDGRSVGAGSGRQPAVAQARIEF